MAPKVFACAEARVAEAEVRICVRLSALPQLRGHLKHAPSDFVVNELRGTDGSEVVLSVGAAGMHSSLAMLRRDKRARVEENDEAQAHVRFTLHKIRRGTLDALVQLADHLRIPQRNFSVCGIKDAFAVTTQEVVARGASVEALRALKLHDMMIGDARVTDGPLRVGGAAGNRFTIRVRGMSVLQPQLERAAAALRAQGFVNYYGLQRFGTAHVKSFELGRRLLRRDYAGLLEAIVCVPTAAGSSMAAEEREARDHFALTHDAGAALRRFPRRLRLERELLARLRRAELKEEPGGWEARCRAAILSLPLSKRKLWANAYYSLVFNLCATERIARFGARPVVGDLVLAGAARSTTQYAAEARSTGARPRVVSREDVEGGVYAIGDVVLPLMGAWVETPANEIGLLCRSYITYDGIEHHTLEVRNSECAAAWPRLAAGSGAQHGGAQAGGCAGGGRATWRGRCDGYVVEEGGEEEASLPDDACAEAEAAEVEARVRAGQDEGVLEDAEAGADCTAASAGSLLAAAGHGSPLADGLDQCEDGEDDCPGGPAWNGEYELRGSYRHLVAYAHGLTFTTLEADEPTPLPSGRMHFSQDSPLNLPRASLPTALPAAGPPSDEAAVQTAARKAAHVTDAVFSFSLPAGSYATVALREVIQSEAEIVSGEAAANAAASGACAGVVQHDAASAAMSRHIRFESESDNDSDNNSRI